ncbi:Hypothetical predicted protein, partial [Xyrichtys novacula]
EESHVQVHNLRMLKRGNNRKPLAKSDPSNKIRFYSTRQEKPLRHVKQTPVLDQDSDAVEQPGEVHSSVRALQLHSGRERGLKDGVSDMAAAA